MNNDRETLEMAAKAAGIDVYWGHASHQFIWKNKESGHEYPEPVFWNPITDDGDALRLAVNLGLKIEQRDGCIGVQWVDRRGNPEEWPDYLAVPINGDPYAATRRAIVRAAAEIGRGMT